MGLANPNSLLMLEGLQFQAFQMFQKKNPSSIISKHVMPLTRNSNNVERVKYDKNGTETSLAFATRQQGLIELDAESS